MVEFAWQAQRVACLLLGDSQSEEGWEWYRANRSIMRRCLSN